MRTFLAALCGGLVVLIGFSLWYPGSASAPLVVPSKTAFERVMQSRTLRCGYIVKPPFFTKDPATGEFSGMIYDLMEEIGQTLNLKIDWAEEVTFATMLEGLKAKRYDSVCMQLYTLPALMPLMEFSTPYFYMPIHLVQRKGESRFKTTADIDKPEIKIASIDGTISSKIAQEDFKNAAALTMPDITPYVENLLAVQTKKADVAFTDTVLFYNFIKTNPDQLELNAEIPPIRVYANGMGFSKGERDLATTVSLATQHLLNSGKVEQIIKKYEPFPGAILRIAPPYLSEGKK